MVSAVPSPRCCMNAPSAIAIRIARHGDCGGVRRLARIVDRRQARHQPAPMNSSSFGLQDSADRHLSTYSGGMRRRLDLALSLTGRPDIVFLDEPTTGLDPRSRFAMWEVIESLVAGGTTVLLCTQYLEEADRLAQRVVILDEGQVVAEGPPDDLRRQVGGIVVELDLHNIAQRTEAIRVLAPTTTSPITGEADDRHLRIPVIDTEQLAAVVRLLDGALIPFHALALHEPTLDDGFLTLTGHATKHNEEDTK